MTLPDFQRTPEDNITVRDAHRYVQSCITQSSQCGVLSIALCAMYSTSYHALWLSHHPRGRVARPLMLPRNVDININITP
eukprot:1180587-Prorocentrum_minimum.AAC.5